MLAIVSTLKTRRAQWILLGLVVLTVAAVLMAKKLRKDRKQKEAELKEIDSRIETGRGAGGTDIKAVLSTVGLFPNAQNRATVAPYVQQIHDAKGALWGLMNDDEQAVYDALSAMDVQLIKVANLVFQEKYGNDLDEWLDARLGGFMNYDQYRQAVAIVRARKIAAQPRK